MSSIRARVIVLVAICALAIGGAVAYISMSRAHQSAERAKGSPAAQTTLGAVAAGPHIVFRNTNPRSDFGQVAVVSLAARAGWLDLPGGPGLPASGGGPQPLTLRVADSRRLG